MMSESPIGLPPLLILILDLTPLTPTTLVVVVIEGEREKSVSTRNRDTIKKLEEESLERVDN